MKIENSSTTKNLPQSQSVTWIHIRRHLNFPTSRAAKAELGKRKMSAWKREYEERERLPLATLTAKDFEKVYKAFSWAELDVDIKRNKLIACINRLPDWVLSGLAGSFWAVICFDGAINARYVCISDACYQFFTFTFIELVKPVRHHTNCGQLK